MRIYKTQNVFDEALDRIRIIFDEFEEVWVSYSGGKDSTVIFELAKIVAKEKDRLPLKVIFLDQEAEYQSTIDVVKHVMYQDEVEPYWIQAPIRLFNATSNKTEWLECWNPDKEDIWMREKDPISYKENIWGTDRFHDFFEFFIDKETRDRGNPKSCVLTGVRGEESPNRLTGLTNSATYKWITWGKRNTKNRETYNFHPLYDWNYPDVWKAIHDNDWKYNKIYDFQYQYGVTPKNMRVSNLHHETSVSALFMLQEMEPDTYQRLTQRIDGMDTAGKLGKDDYFIYELPFMFKDWREYRDYLLEKLITNPDHREKMRRRMDKQEEKFGVVIPPHIMFRTHINTILTNDYHGTKLKNAASSWNMKLRDYKRRMKRDEMARRKAERERKQNGIPQ